MAAVNCASQDLQRHLLSLFIRAIMDEVNYVKNGAIYFRYTIKLPTSRSKPSPFDQSDCAMSPSLSAIDFVAAVRPPPPP